MVGETITVLFLVWISIIGANAEPTKEIIERLEKRCFAYGVEARYILQTAPLRSFNFRYGPSPMETEMFAGLDFLCFEDSKDSKDSEREGRKEGKRGRNLKKQGNKGKTRDFSGNSYGT